MRTANHRSPRSLLQPSLPLAFATLFAGACAVSPSDAPDPDESTVSADVVTFGTLSLVRERKISAIIPTSTSNYEASGVQLHNNQLYIVFDDMTQIGHVALDLLSGGYTAGGAVTNSQYEAITFDSNNTEHFYVAVEQANPTIVQLDSAANATSAVSQSTNVHFSNSNTAFEGLAWTFRNNNDYLLGLCEGINCTSSTSTPGRGQIEVMAQSGGHWVADPTPLLLPAAVTFKDYSDLALMPNSDGTFKVAVTSQESKALWIGTLSGTSWSFIGDGKIYPMPSADYCNVEGVTFLSATQVAMVSDQYKGTDAGCNSKDEMVHIFNLL